MTLQRVGVYCGSRNGSRPEYAQAARELGTTLAERGLELVYGGARRGLMGVLADAALAGGGKVIGVIPLFMTGVEIVHRGLTDLRVVATMHERKILMFELADAFIALPGGFGTLEEFCEVITWSQLGLHRKPHGLLNVAGYYDDFLKLLVHGAAEGFVHGDPRQIILDDTLPARLLDRLAQASPARGAK
jgi:uncharacterized protein (TIGR00730 family)